LTLSLKSDFLTKLKPSKGDARKIESKYGNSFAVQELLGDDNQACLYDKWTSFGDKSLGNHNADQLSQHCIKLMEKLEEPLEDYLMSKINNNKPWIHFAEVVCFSGKKPLCSVLWTPEEMPDKRESKAERNLREGNAFLEEKSAEAGVFTTTSGLRYKTLVKGPGSEHPTADNRVRVHYRGTTPAGVEFDSSYKRGEPAVFALRGVIAVELFLLISFLQGRASSDVELIVCCICSGLDGSPAAYGGGGQVRIVFAGIAGLWPRYRRKM
jgi:hypothetical protein